MRTSGDGAFAHFDGMTWPVPGERAYEAEHRLRLGEATRDDILLAASVLAAYRQMVGDTETKRRRVLRRIRAALAQEMSAPREKEGKA